MARRISSVRGSDGRPDRDACRRVLRGLSKAALEIELLTFWMAGFAPHDGEELAELRHHDRDLRAIIAGHRVFTAIKTMENAVGASATRFKRAERAVKRALQARDRAVARCGR